MSASALIENFLQALVAGILVGSLYGLMCVGLGLIFGIMRVINFAQGEFLMLGMYFTFYIVTGFGLLSFLGPYAGPFVGAILAGPVLMVGGYLLHRYLVSRVTGIRALGRGEPGPLCAAHPHPGRCAGAAERRPHPVRVDTAIGAHAAVGQRLGDRPAVRRVCGGVRQPGAHRVGRDLGCGDRRAVLVHRACAPGQGPARGCGQSRGRRVHGDRRRSRASAGLRDRDRA